MSTNSTTSARLTESLLRLFRGFHSRLITFCRSIQNRLICGRHVFFHNRGILLKNFSFLNLRNSEIVQTFGVTLGVHTQTQAGYEEKRGQNRGDPAEKCGRSLRAEHSL